MLNWNGLEDTKACVDSLLKTNRQEFDLTVLDNGSKDADLDALSNYSSLGNVEVLGSETNLGFTRGVNAYLPDLDQYEFIVLLNNDTVVDPDWLDQLVRCAEKNNADMVSSKMVNFYDRDVMDNAGHLWLNTGEILPIGTWQSTKDYNQEAANIVGACAGAALYRTSMLKDIGMFDEYFTTGYEDAEHGLRALLAGYKIVYCPSAVVYHKVSASLDKVRDFSYAVSIQRNIYYTTLKLTPWPVLAINLPFILGKTFGILLTSLMFLRTKLFKAHWRAIVETWRDRRKIAAARREALQFRRISSLQVLASQKFFLPVYWRYFRRYILTGKPTVFEK